MSKNDRSKEILTTLSKSIADGLEIPVHVVDEDLIDQLAEAASSLEGIEEKYTPLELRNEIEQFVSEFVVIPPKDTAALEQRIDGFLASLERLKLYEAMVFIPGLLNVPSGVELGRLKVVDKPEDDSGLQEHMDLARSRHRINPDNGTYCFIEFESYRSLNLTDLLFKEMDLPLAIFSLFTSRAFDTRVCTGMIRSKQISRKLYFYPKISSLGWSRLRLEDSEEILARLSEITLSKKPSPLKEKLLQSLSVFGLSRYSPKHEIRLLMVISALESLLLTNNDRDYLGKRLAEKVAFLLETSFEGRKSLYSFIKRAYRARSDLVHRGNSEVSETYAMRLDYIYRRLVLKVLNLTDDYQKMEKKSGKKDEEGVEDLLDTYRFS